MASFLDQFTKSMKSKSEIAAKIKDAENWFRSKVGELGGKFTKNSREALIKRFEEMDQPTIGSIVLFFYDPKHKLTLPYYDRFPMSILISPTKEGFAGLNMHYLEPILRARLFDALLNTRTSKKYTDTTRLAVTYDMLKATQTYAAFKPCYKQYLTGHVRSSIVIVPPQQWKQVLFLPLQQFAKATDKEVWRESRNKF
jgi:hypothetical protein